MLRVYMAKDKEIKKRSFIIDEEIDLFEQQAKDAVQKKDLLNTSTYVNTLTNSVLSAPEDKPFTIGLFGEWGSGKSSIIKTFSKDVVEKFKAENKNVKVITYDAWKYANDSFRRMFLLRMQEELGFEGNELFNSFYLNTSEDVHIYTKIKYRELIIGIIILVVAYVWITKYTDFQESGKILATAIVSLVALIYSIVRNLFKEVKVNIQTPHLFAPEQFEACFNEMCDKALAKVPIATSFLKYINGESGESGLDKLIIVIDNVDRCSSELAYELLTNIKNFLGKKKGIMFVIPVDEIALKKHIVNNKQSLGRESDEFLRKFFNICIRIKPFHQEEMFEFADQLNIKYGLGLNSNTIGLISQEFASNPRRIIQIMNNLIVEFQNIPQRYVENDESLICKLLIIREEYPKFYNGLVNDVTLLFDDAKQHDYINPNDALKRFLYRTNSISLAYKDKIETVETIMSNSVVFDKIPTNVINEISSDDVKKSLVYLSQSSANKDKLLNYILQKIGKSISRKNYKAGVNLQLNYLMRISKNAKLTNKDYVRIADEICGLSLKDFFEGESSMRPFEEFAQKLNSESLPTLNNELKSFYINCRESGLDKKMVRDGLFYGFTIWDGNLLYDLQNELIESYKAAPAEIFDYDYGKNNCAVFNDTIQNLIIDSQFKDKILEDKDKNLFLKLINTITISPEKLSAAIGIIAENVENFTNSRERRNQIEQLSNYLTLILSSLPHDYILKDTTTLNTLMTKFCHTYNDNTYSSTTRSYFKEVESDDIRKNFVDCFFQASRISRADVINQNYLKIMLSVPSLQLHILDKLNDLLAYKFPMSKYASAILEISTLSPVLLKIYRYLFIVKLLNKYAVDNTVVKQKMKMVLVQLQANESTIKKESEELVLAIFSDARGSEVLMDIISQETSENILKYPESVQKLIIPIFNDHFDEYADNMQVMHVMASSSNKELISKVVTKISNMLTTAGKEKEAFSLIKDLKIVDKKQANMLISTLEVLELKDVLIQERDECMKLLKGM